MFPEPDAVAGLALFSAWDDLPSLAAVHFPAWLVRVTLTDRWDSLAAARGLDRPVLMGHGSRDSIIPIAHGRRLHAALKQPAGFVELAHAEHNDLFAHDEIWRALAAFLAGFSG